MEHFLTVWSGIGNRDGIYYICNYHYPRNDKTVPERGNGTTP